MTIQELAALAGVSPATVSRVFAHHQGIRAEVREKILSIAREHGYHPRVEGKRRNVVIITPYNSVYPVQSCVDMLLMALTRNLPERNFRLEILPLNSLERLESIPFCAAAAIGVDASDFSDWNERFASPLLILDRSPEEGKHYENICFVRSDEEQGMSLAVHHLYACGCRRIGCIIHGEPGRGNADIRKRSVEKVLRSLKLPVNDRLICFSGTGNEKYVELIGKLLKSGADALFCPGGNAGIVGSYAFSLYGKKIPGDVSFISSEQTFFSRFGVPPLTTITQDYDALGKTVADVIEEYLDNTPLPGMITIPYRLIERESCREKPPELKEKGQLKR